MVRERCVFKSPRKGLSDRKSIGADAVGFWGYDRMQQLDKYMGHSELRLMGYFPCCVRCRRGLQIEGGCLSCLSSLGVIRIVSLCVGSFVFGICFLDCLCCSSPYWERF